MILDSLNHVEGRGVHSFHHRRQHVSGRFIVLVGVDADRQLVRGACSFEYSLTGRAGGVEDHFDALIVLTERQLFALAWILERVGRDARVLHDHLAIRTDFLHAGPISRLELVNERNVHSADESDFLGVTYHRRESADQIRSFFFAKLERGNVWRG